jgi:hypothetical protein
LLVEEASQAEKCGHPFPLTIVFVERKVCFDLFTCYVYYEAHIPTWTLDTRVVRVSDTATRLIIEMFVIHRLKVNRAVNTPPQIRTT